MCSRQVTGCREKCKPQFDGGPNGSGKRRGELQSQFEYNNIII